MGSFLNNLQRTFVLSTDLKPMVLKYMFGK
jgi:hypothetical protein